MTRERLELVSAHGDQTLPQVRFAAHESSLSEGIEIQRHGLRFIEARSAVSTSMIGASSSIDGEARVISIVAIPASFHLGYAASTTAYIDRSLKLVTGAPLRYADGRRHLALYRAEDTEAAREVVEAEVLSGFALNDHPSFEVEPRFVVGGFTSGSGLDRLLTYLEVSAESFELVDFAKLEHSLQGLFTVREPAQAVLVPTLVRDMIMGTIESAIMSRLRMMRWEGLALLGYRFIEDDQDVEIARPADMAEHRRQIDEYERQLASSKLFDGELAWLKTYGTRQLALMRVELEAAELEAD
jgi:hypothetical protein